MVADPVFVDTNVLIYATRRTASEHPVAQAALARLEGEGRAPVDLQLAAGYSRRADYFGPPPREAGGG
jgi:predicted nucleic acid-binding protein